MQFKLDPQKTIELLPDGSYVAHIVWYEDDADPEKDAPVLIDHVRLPYWHLMRNDQEREQYLLAQIAERHKELMRQRQLQSLAETPQTIRSLAGAVHRITPDGKITLRKVQVVENVIEVPNEKVSNPLSHQY